MVYVGGGLGGGPSHGSRGGGGWIVLGITVNTTTLNSTNIDSIRAGSSSFPNFDGNINGR